MYAVEFDTVFALLPSFMKKFWINEVDRQEVIIYSKTIVTDRIFRSENFVWAMFVLESKPLEKGLSELKRVKLTAIALPALAIPAILFLWSRSAILDQWQMVNPALYVQQSLLIKHKLIILVRCHYYRSTKNQSKVTRPLRSKPVLSSTPSTQTLLVSDVPMTRSK
ncbi:hypothetical protein Ciccas_004123 [Cichlidogyrus casuarinus]|uniref:Uncharacterized protein n=1 Tax=Cichlidogyrus casuarinus TaxID=1844966 RepID=A0ABD2QDC4_9PLAT